MDAQGTDRATKALWVPKLIGNCCLIWALNFAPGVPHGHTTSWTACSLPRRMILRAAEWGSDSSSEGHQPHLGKELQCPGPAGRKPEAGTLGQGATQTLGCWQSPSLGSRPPASLAGLAPRRFRSGPKSLLGSLSHLQCLVSLRESVCGHSPAHPPSMAPHCLQPLP